MSNQGATVLVFWALLILIVVSSISPASNTVVKCNESTSYIHPAVDGLTRVAVRKDGEFIIHFLLELTNSDKCERVTRLGIRTILTAQYAIDKVNSDPSLLPAIKLGYQLDDGCVSLPVTMARALEIVSLHRPHSQCRVGYIHCLSVNANAQEIKPAIAVIGTRRSFLTIPVASLMDLYKIPEISPSATSRLLEKRDLFRSFFRTISSDTAQVQVLIDVIKFFKWNYIFAIGSDDDYGKMGIAELKAMASLQEVCVVQDEYVPFSSVNTDSRIVYTVSKMKLVPEATVVVLFGYASKQGDLILSEAARQNVKRVWLTSEAWNPEALDLKIEKEMLLGVLTVSIVVTKSPDLFQYAQEHVTLNFNCDPWLKKYLKDEYGCEVDRTENGYLMGRSCLGSDSSICKPCQLNITDLVSTDYMMRDRTEQNLIDAVYAVAHGLRNVISASCGADIGKCQPTKVVSPAKLTDAMYNVSFTNANGVRIAFDSKGNPAEVKYTIENIQAVEDGLQYVVVGEWDTVTGLNMSKEEIVWPYWANNKVPLSVCSEDCPPGTHFEGRAGCCWKCAPCANGFKSNSTMSASCTPCPVGYHTLDKIICVETPIVYLKASDAFGITLIVLSAIGFMSTASVGVILIKLQPCTKFNSDLHLLALSLIALTMGFAHVFFHVVMPTDTTCVIQTAWFFLLVMLFSAIFLVKTVFISSMLNKCTLSISRCRLATAQTVFVVLLLALESTALSIWLVSDPNQSSVYQPRDKYEKWIECKLAYTAPRLVTTIVPGVVLLTATIQSLRERKSNMATVHGKFLSFACIAFCIVMAVFLPTYKYVVGIYRSVVSVFTVDMCSFTFLSCILIPRVYACLTAGPPQATLQERKNSTERQATDTTDAGGPNEDFVGAETVANTDVCLDNRFVSNTMSSTDGRRIRRHRRILARQYTI